MVIWFYADDILAWLQLDPNQTYVPLARLCDRLGLAPGPEERRLKGSPPLASRARRLMIETEVGERRMLCLPVDALPLWLTMLDSTRVVDAEGRARLELFQREAASVLWQAFRPQGYDSGDGLVPERPQQAPAEQAYVGVMAMAALARQQLLIERQLDAPIDDERQGADPWAARAAGLADPAAARAAQTARRIAHTLGERTRRNEYYGVFSGLYRNFGIASYRRMPPARLYEAMEWLERWRGDLLGEPEPPPDI